MNRSYLPTAPANGYLPPELIVILIGMGQPRAQAGAQPPSHAGQLSACGIGAV